MSFFGRTNLFRVERSTLFEESQPDDYVPMSLDIVEVEHQSEGESENNQDDEFDFPLFSFGGEEKKDEEERGRTSVMKVSLREESVERIIQERPESYYFASYTEEEVSQFGQASITGEEIIIMSKQKDIDSHPWKVLDLNRHNEIIEQEKPKKKSRPGKNKRLGIIKSRERKAERQKVFKEVEKQHKKYLKKKMFHKRGGKKHKKKENKDDKPKYRTE